MIGYYFRLALHSLRRNVVLTTLTILAVAVGIGASMTVLTVLIAMSGDPIPGKSSQLFAVQIDNWGPQDRDPKGEPPDQLTYTDVMGLMKAKRAPRQAAMYGVALSVMPADDKSAAFNAAGRATFRDFFAMFETPFLHGGPWSVADDEAHANVVVLGDVVAKRLFGTANPVGRTVSVDEHDYQVVGVLDAWEPNPKYYDLNTGDFASGDEVYLPFNTSIDRQMSNRGNNNCNQSPAPGYEGHLHSECVWMQFWAELPTATDERAYRDFLNSYAAEQQRIGRFTWDPLTRLRNVRDWLEYREVVSREYRVSTLLAFGFLLVCLVNAIGLMLAKFTSRAGELSVRRALGASRRDIFMQCLMETAVVGVVGGLLGLGVTALGLAAERQILPEEYAKLPQLDVTVVVLTLSLAILSMLIAGLYPTWRASRVQPAWQLKAQ